MRSEESNKSKIRRGYSGGRNQFDESKTKMSLDYIFGPGTSKGIDFSRLSHFHSRKTGRLKQIEDESSRRILFTFRPNGTIAPTTAGASALMAGRNDPKSHYAVTLIDGVSEIVAAGKTVFCKHVVSCSDSLRPGEDVIILNEEKQLLAVGRTVIGGPAMKQFKRGQAVKVREGSQ